MPSWDVLYEIAAAQRGYFTARQARDAGYSSALLRHYVRTRQDQRVRHGIYRLAKFPASEHEELMVEWLWTGGVGVFSHETVLSLHELSDVLPTQFHLTVPTAWRHRRLTIPTESSSTTPIFPRLIARGSASSRPPPFAGR